ncbi:MAG: Ni/Fe hydrogenase subunit alpha [Bacteroidetes bacterium]|nr:Ni/Fe hydrogenase subunit alpha [Bacteroidota bacterium]
MKTKTLKVDYLARVEGEGGLLVKISGKKVTDVKFNIFEPPRFFEAFLRGRMYSEAPDITARICGICPVAYQMSSVHAMEQIFGLKVDGQLRALRRLLYCGEWIESHALHVFMLHAPDFLGYADAIQMAKDHGKVVQMALKLKKTGNDIVNLIGGREIHPINIRVGGFYKLPTKKELETLVDRLKWAVDASIQTVKFTAKLPFPEFERHYEFVALRHENEYPFNEGRLVSNKGLDIDVQEYENHFMEEHVSHSTALHSILKERGAYFTGPLARYNLNFDKLTPAAQDAAKSAGIGKGTNNPFKSIIVRAVEILYACEEALRIIKEYTVPDKNAVTIDLKPGTGCGCTEAPRGILYHRYRLDEKGIILDAKIVPPTSQNQKTIEQDLREYIPPRINLPQEKLTWQCEQAIRNYDPCISCSTHFLKLKMTYE